MTAFNTLVLIAIAGRAFWLYHVLRRSQKRASLAKLPSTAELQRQDSIKQRLAAANAAAQRVRVRVVGIVVGAGVTMMFLGVVLYAAAREVTDALGPHNVYVCFMVVGTCLFFFAVQPVDQKLVRKSVIFCYFFAALSGGAFAFEAVLIVGMQSVVGSESLSPEERKGARISLANNVLVAFMWYLGAAGMVPTFWPAAPRGPSKGRRKSSGSRWSMSPRAALHHFWAVLRCVFVASAVQNLILCLGFDAPKPSSDAGVGAIALSATQLLCAALSAPTVRSRARRALARLGLSGEVHAAATIANLVGGVGAPKQALELARKNFRGLPFGSLTEDDLLASGANLADSDLASRTVHALEGCDAFVSHSWRDDGHAKWKLLQKWAKDFEKKFAPDARDGRGARDPLLWLDKACIDQNNIDESLACLPIFLAGCAELLVLAGPTYTERLWCVMEIFTFFQIGKRVDRVTVVPLEAADATSDERDAAHHGARRFQPRRGARAVFQGRGPRSAARHRRGGVRRPLHVQRHRGVGLCRAGSRR